jgi:tetratricopeptide (TPR) repeat protein
MAYSAIGLSSYCKGMFEDATRHYIKGAELCEKVNHFYSTALTHFNLGETYHQLQEYQKSKDHYSRAIWLMEQDRSFPFWIKLFRAGLARAKASNNEKDIDLGSLYEYARDNKVNLYEGWISRYIGEILLCLGRRHFSDAEYWFKRALKADEAHGVMFHLGNDYTSYAKLQKRKGDLTGAKKSLYSAMEIFKKCGADVWGANVEKDLMSLA